jgi:SPP1 family predicted phage head-tail adaptor
MPLNAGDLRHRITLQVRTETQDPEHGGMTDTWTNVRSRLSALVAQLDGRELERARQIDPRIDITVTLRYWSAYRTQLTARHRVIWHDGAHDRTLEIVGGPVETEHRETLVLRCKEER